MDAWCVNAMQWGRDDCMLAVADVVLTITGKDPARRFRGTYRTKLGARRVLGRSGTLRAARASASALHWKPIAPADAKPGDVGLIAISVKGARGKVIKDYAAMVCLSSGWFVGRKELGFTAFASEKLAFAWSIR